jgi:hypothetical protein
MDERPAQVARAYADLCYRVGKLGCFLQLQIRIMGDQFDRVAYSSYGEAAHETESKRLAETGLDVDRFFRGLLVHFAGVERRGELGPWRLARSIQESGRTGSLVPALARMAESPDLDEYNRLRATQVLALMNEIAGVNEARLPATSRDWLEEHRASKKR